MLTIIALFTCLIWLWLAFAHGAFWHCSERLTDAPAPNKWPHVVTIIPARDEAETIGQAVAAHQNSDYPGELTLILADDGSTDGTADIAKSNATLDVVSVPDLPPGWTGKLWAVESALIRAEQIAPEAKYVLLSDADILLPPDTLSRLVAKAEHEKLALTSLMARLDSRGPWAAFLIPAFIYFFQKLYPFPRANNPDDNLAAAAGGCMLARKDGIEAIGGMNAIHANLIDDCAFARRMKDLTPSTKIWLGIASDEAISLRDNRSLQSIWNMVARTAYAQLSFSPLLLIGTLIGMGLVYLAAPLILLSVFYHTNFIAIFFSAIACGFMAYTFWPTLRLYGRAPWEAVLLPVSAGIYAAMTLTSALRHWRGRGGQWKGRSY